jgi:hypothetical protein
MILRWVRVAVQDVWGRADKPLEKVIQRLATAG